MNELDQIQLYQAEDGTITIDVKIEEDSVWLTQKQMTLLFGQTKQNISLHINNCFKEGELISNSVVKESLTVQTEGKRKIERNIKYYNLDVIISVGYRVKSKSGTQFRIWANQILKNYLLKGYALNEQKLTQKAEQLEELKKMIDLQAHIIQRQELSNMETQGLLKVIHSYSKALDILDDYDYQRLKIPTHGHKEVRKISYNEAKNAITELGNETGATELFGKEKDKSFEGSLQTIYQTFDGKELYPTLGEKASHLLYFIVKNHSFVDGNKRIGAFVFIWFLDLNQSLFNEKGKKMFTEELLVAITLMIAESKPEDKEMIVKVVVNLIT